VGFLKRLFQPRGNRQHEQKQMNVLYQECLSTLDAELYRRLQMIVNDRFATERPDAIIAHAKLYCTGEGESEKSIQSSTPEERALARNLADEIMAENVPGLYGVALTHVPRTAAELPEDLSSVRRLALCYDQFFAILIASLATDVTDPSRPVVNRELIREKALPLLENAEAHDPSSSVLQTTVAQTYYTLGEVDRGLSAASTARELDANNAEAWRLVGNGLIAMGHYDEARACIERALSINPMLDGARQALGLLSQVGA
jgi:tetratricopeptide (TPR) repeat protein